MAPIGFIWHFSALRINVAGMKNFFRVALSLGVLAGLVLLERKRPLRRERESKLRRNSRNLAVAALGALTVQLLEAPIVKPLARSVEKRKLGLLKQLNLPRPLEIIAAIEHDRRDANYAALQQNLRDLKRARDERGRKLDVGLGWFRRRSDPPDSGHYCEHLGGAASSSRSALCRAHVQASETLAVDR